MGMGHGDESGDRSMDGSRSRDEGSAFKPGFSDGMPIFAENATSKHLEAD